MGSTYLAFYMHLVWSTANRHPWIDAAWQARLFAYMGGIVRDKNAVLLAAGGMPDHVHLLVSLSATLTLAQPALERATPALRTGYWLPALRAWRRGLNVHRGTAAAVGPGG